MQRFSPKEILTNHQEVCLEINAKWDTEIAEKGSNIKFTGHPNETCDNKCQEHIGCSYRYKVVCMDDRFNKPIKYRVEDAIYEFIIENLFISLKKISIVKILWKKHYKEENVMSKENERHFRKAKKCHVFNKLYILKNLVQNSPKNKFNYLSQKFNEKQLALVKQKGYYPYEHLNSFERFDETKLPNKEALNTLNEKHIGEQLFLKNLEVYAYSVMG